ncbi:glutaredoxin domain-containing protein [Actinoplanes sp. NPDC049596]|uniref:glutaredoxin domain-containing protein n=1 Tax=unclassified Actinoplanes TaxID=2626549 RepID=UPI003415639E
MFRRWLPSIVVLAAALALGAGLLTDGRVLQAIVLLVLLVAAAVVLSPRGFPESVSDAAAREASTRDGRAIVYWRPGCPYCARLRVSLGRHASRLHWVDIWQDPDGAASVRAVADGNETVPTVVASGKAFVNPSPRWVRQLTL